MISIYRVFFIFTGSFCRFLSRFVFCVRQTRIHFNSLLVRNIRGVKKQLWAKKRSEFSSAAASEWDVSIYSGIFSFKVKIKRKKSTLLIWPCVLLGRCYGVARYFFLNASSLKIFKIRDGQFTACRIILESDDRSILKCLISKPWKVCFSLWC